MPLSGAQPLYQRFSHRDLAGLLAQVVRLLLFCLSAAQNLGTPGILCHVDADCLHYGIHTAAYSCEKLRKTEQTSRSRIRPRGLEAHKPFGYLRKRLSRQTTP